MDFAGAVGGDDHDRRRRRLDDAELGDGDLKVGQHFEQIGLKSFVGAVDLVDQQHRRAAVARLQRLQQRAADEIALGEDVVLDAVAVLLAGGFGEADRHHLRGIVPLIDGAGDVEPFIALQADQLAAERGGENLGDLGLADARLALEQDWTAQPKAEKQHRRQRAVGDIGGGAQQLERGVDAGGSRGLRSGVHARLAMSDEKPNALRQAEGRSRGRRREGAARHIAATQPAAATARLAITPIRWAR